MISSSSSPNPGPLLYDVVSVQSQVVYGRVGNSVAVPTLEALGLEVATVPTVVLGNTPDYPTLSGGALPLDWFSGYLEDLKSRGALGSLRAVLTGYLGTADQVRVLAPWIRALLDQNPELRVVVDPVTGDSDDGLYVDPDLADAIRSELVPLADGLAPNGFELEYLTGKPANDLDQVVVAARSLLAGRTRWVAVTSAVPGIGDPDSIRVVLVTRDTAWLVTHPRIPTVPKGTGDLFSASLTGLWLNGADLPDAALGACRHLVQVLRRTERANCGELRLFPMGPCGAGDDEVTLHELGRGPVVASFFPRSETP